MDKPNIMDQNFQTSFIPKKPMTAEPVQVARPVGFFVLISVFVLFTVAIATGGLYFYQGVLTKNITNMQTQLDVAKNRFEPSKITELQVLDKRLRASTEILSKHIAISPIFKSLELITMKTVRYNKFTYTLGGDKNSPIKVNMSGVAVGYRSIALQSDLFLKNKSFIDPVFSNLNLDDKGNVTFNLEFTVDPIFIDYKQNILTAQ